MSKLLLRLGFFVVLMLGLIFLLMPLKTQALEIGKPDQTQQVNLLASQTIEDNLIAVGELVKIEGTIKGDLLVIANRFEFKGKIEGNLFVLADRAFLEGQISRDVYSISKNLVASETLNVQKDFYGVVLENFSNLGAKIGGKTQVSQLKALKPQKISFGTVVTRQLFGFISTLLFGWLLLWLFPKLTTKIAEFTSAHLGKSLLVGLASLIIMLVGGILAIFTIIGLPIGLVLLGFFWFAIYTAWIWTSLALGKFLTGERYNQVFRLFLGLLILKAIALTPAIGGLLAFLVVFAGTGSLVYVLLKLRETL